MNKTREGLATSWFVCVVLVNLIVLAGAVSAGTEQCGNGESNYPSDRKIKIPDNTRVVFLMDDNGKVQVLGPSLQPFAECRLCPYKEPEKCREQPGICQSHVNATMRKISQITLMETSVNPICWSYVHGGVLHEQCWCNRGESDRRCINQ